MIGGKSSLINATWKIGGGEPAQLCRKTKLQVPHKVNYRCSAIAVSSFIRINQELLKGWYRTSKEAAMIWQTLQWDRKRGPVLHMWLWSLYILVEFPLSLPFGSLHQLFDMMDIIVLLMSKQLEDKSKKKKSLLFF